MAALIEAIGRAAAELAYAGAILGCFWWIVRATSHLTLGATP